MTALLDANLLIAVSIADHVHHDVAERWIANWDDAFATCPITEGALVRTVLRGGGSVADALESLDSLRLDRRFEFWPDDLPYRDVSWHGVLGHRQVTDAYLAGLVRARSATLATLDRGLAALHPDVAVLVGT